MTLPHGGELPDSTPLLDEDDEALDTSDLRWIDAFPFVVFWVLAFVVFLQFFSRYVLNSSFAWTEEIARYLLIWATFFGLVMVVRKESNIAVEIFYRWMPMGMRRVLSTVVDLISVAFFAKMTLLCIQLAQRTRQSMTSIDWPKSLIYWGVTAGLAVCTLYALYAAWVHWRTRSSPLIRMTGPVQTPDRPGME